MGINGVLDYLQGTDNIAVIIRLVLATVLGCLVGWERVARHHRAGIKTFALVSLGSAVAAALNIHLSELAQNTTDIGRIPAAVVSGIGFLGAGTILVTGRKQIKGLSTAASLWVTSCMGMAIGAAYLVVGVSGFLLIAFTNLVLFQLSSRVEEYSRYISIYVEVSIDNSLKSINEFCNEQGFRVVSVMKSKEKTLRSADIALILDLDLEKMRSHNEVLQIFNDLDYVDYVEEV